MRLDCDPVFDYGRRRGSWRVNDTRPGEATLADTGGAVQLAVTGSIALRAEHGLLRGRQLVHEGEEMFVTLSWSGAQPSTTT